MDAQPFKINIIRRIISLEDSVLLKRIAEILDEPNPERNSMEAESGIERKYIVDIHSDFAIITTKKGGKLP